MHLFHYYYVQANNYRLSIVNSILSYFHNHKTMTNIQHFDLSFKNSIKTHEAKHFTIVCSSMASELNTLFLFSFQMFSNFIQNKKINDVSILEIRYGVSVNNAFYIILTIATSHFHSSHYV